MGTDMMIARWLLPLLTLSWMGALLYFSVRPTVPEIKPAGPSGFRVTATMLHLGGYAVLGMLMNGTLMVAGRTRRRSLGSAGAAALLAFLWGAFNETLQAFVPERVLQGKDFLFNGLGATVGALGTALLVRHGPIPVRHGGNPASPQR